MTSHEDLWIAGKPTPATAPWLQELLRLVESRPPIAERWMTTPDLSEANNRVAHLAIEADALAETERHLSHWTPDWSKLDPTAAGRLDQVCSRIAELDPTPDFGHTGIYRLSRSQGQMIESHATPSALEDHTSTQLCALKDAVADSTKIIEMLSAVARELTTAFGVNDDVSPMMLDRLAKLVSWPFQRRHPSRTGSRTVRLKLRVKRIECSRRSFRRTLPNATT